MKINFQDSDYFGEFSIRPETVAEMAQLLRLVRNAKKEPPQMYLSFQGNDPYLYLTFEKVRKEKQIKSISK